MIYVTSFNDINKNITAPSCDSGMKGFDEVLSLMGANYMRQTKRMIIYKGVVFSDFSFT